MKLRRYIIPLIITLFLIVLINYMIISFKKSSAPPKPSLTPNLADAPVRVYGRVEPFEREVFVGPTQSGKVVKIMVKEGQKISAGQPLLELESSVEKQAVEVAKSKVEELKAQLNLVLDELNRKKPLLDGKAVSEIEVSQKELEAELIKKQIYTAMAETELRKKQLELLTLRSPVNGIIYKFDIRLGEYITPQDNQRIIIGDKRKQIRLFIESFWFYNVKVGDVFDVYDAENLKYLGRGKIVYISPYSGARDFRTEDAFERLDTKYTQAILHLKELFDHPLGSLVLCVRAN